MKSGEVSHVLFQTALLFVCMLTEAGCDRPAEPHNVPPQGSTARYLLLAVHGSGDTAQDWPADVIAAAADRLQGYGDVWDLVAYDWSAYSEDRSRASQNGLAVGDAVGRLLASDDYDYEIIHLIGHSVGSFVIHGICRSYVANASEPARLHLTFLDPFTGNGFFDWTYGRRNFGMHADFTEAYINTDDPVPSTNVYLPNAYNVDLTDSPMKNLSGSAAHWWPVIFYALSIENPEIPYGYRFSPGATGPESTVSHGQFPRGDVARID